MKVATTGSSNPLLLEFRSRASQAATKTQVITETAQTITALGSTNNHARLLGNVGTKGVVLERTTGIPKSWRAGNWERELEVEFRNEVLRTERPDLADSFALLMATGKLDLIVGQGVAGSRYSILPQDDGTVVVKLSGWDVTTSGSNALNVGTSKRTEYSHTEVAHTLAEVADFLINDVETSSMKVNRVMLSAGQTLGGALEILGGAKIGVFSGGTAGVVAGMLILNGADNMLEGITGMFSRNRFSAISAILEAAGMSPDTAQKVNLGLDIAVGLGAGLYVAGTSIAAQKLSQFGRVFGANVEKSGSGFAVTINGVTDCYETLELAMNAVLKNYAKNSGLEQRFFVLGGRVHIYPSGIYDGAECVVIKLAGEQNLSRAQQVFLKGAIEQGESAPGAVPKSVPRKAAVTNAPPKVRLPNLSGATVDEAAAKLSNQAEPWVTDGSRFARGSGRSTHSQGGVSQPDYPRLTTQTFADKEVTVVKYDTRFMQDSYFSGQAEEFFQSAEMLSPAQHPGGLWVVRFNEVRTNMVNWVPEAHYGVFDTETAANEFVRLVCMTAD